MATRLQISKPERGQLPVNNMPQADRYSSLDLLHGEPLARILDQKKKSLPVFPSTSVSIILRYADLFSSYHYCFRLFVSQTKFSLRRYRYW